MAAIDLGGGAEVRVINTHLGLVPREQQLQAEALAGEGWLGAPAAGEAVILLGDMNATARASAYQRLAAKLTDAHRTPGGRGQRIATFPAALPFLRIDHIFVSEGVEVKSLRVSASAEAVVASDHRPLVMDFALR
jgi:endonuclease/exonuclease/phosphatase family metal-dependent hydrolase